MWPGPMPNWPPRVRAILSMLWGAWRLPLLVVVAAFLLISSLAVLAFHAIHQPPAHTPAPTPSAHQSTPAAAAGRCPAEEAVQGSGGVTIRGYTPQQLRTRYGVESLCQQGYTGKGQTVIVIVSFGSPTLQQDVDVFSQRFNLPKVTVDVRAPIGTKPFDPSNPEMTRWASETTRDAEMIHGMAPDAKIVVLSSPVSQTEGVQGLPEFLRLEQYAVDHHLGTIVNQSFGASEATLADGAAQQQIARWNAFYQQATIQQGMTFFAAAGDGGATDYCDVNSTRLCTTRTIGFPADTSWVVAVGGTTLTLSGSQHSQNASQGSEQAWSGSEGGFSTFIAEPSYQQRLPPSDQGERNNRRGVPDVAADADPSTAPAVYFSGHWAPIGGTGAASPQWAGIMAVADQMAGHPLGYITPSLYKIGTSDKAAQDFHDITSGNNTNASAGVQGFTAGPGWDPVTGLGTPIADHLLPDLIAAAD